MFPVLATMLAMLTMDPTNGFSFIRLAAVCNFKTFKQNQGMSLVTYPSYKESSLQINIYHLFKVLLLHPEQEPVLGDAGGVDDDVGGVSSTSPALSGNIRSQSQTGKHQRPHCTVMRNGNQALVKMITMFHDMIQPPVCLQESMFRSATTTLALSLARQLTDSSPNTSHQGQAQAPLKSWNPGKIIYII